MVVLSISFGKKVNLGLSAKCSVAVLLLSSSLMSLSNIYFLLWMFTLLVKAELERNEYIMTGYKARCAAWSPVIMKYTMCSVLQWAL